MLQSSPTAWLDGTAIDVGAHFHLDWLPGVVDDEINYTDTWPAGLWNDQHHGVAGFADFNRMKNDIIDPIVGDPDFVTRIRERQYTIWPTNVGNHWVVIIIRTAPKSVNDEPTPHRRVSHIAVVDPARHEKTINLVHQRIRLFLEHHLFTIDDNSRTSIWLPKQRDSWSCGVVAYNIAKVMIKRIKKTVLTSSPGFYSNDIWGPMSGDFQPSKVRLELVGLLAVVALTKEKSAVKITTVPIAHEAGFSGTSCTQRKVKYKIGRVQAYQKPPR